MLQKSSMLKTAEFFFLNPSGQHCLMDISRSIGLAHTSVKKNLIQLVKIGLIQEMIEKKGGRKFPFYKASRDNNLFVKYKKIYNLTSLLESNIVEFIQEKLMPKSIVFFGGYQKGEDTESSDIDIFVQCKREDLNLNKFEKMLGRKIELHFKEDFASYPKELKNNIVNGIVVSGFLEAYK